MVNADTTADRMSLAIEHSRLPLIVGVVLIHSYSTVVHLSSGQIGSESGYSNLFVQNLFSQVIARIAVPSFYLVSGFLLYRGREITLGLFCGKLRSRAVTLLWPYLLWNTIVIAVQIAGQSMPFSARFFSGQMIDVDALTVHNVLDAYIGFDRGPANAPLWFLRDLIVLVILSPALYILARKAGTTAGLLLFGVWLVSPLSFDTFLSTEAAFFFYLGLLLSVRDGGILRIIDRIPLMVLALLYACVAVIESHGISISLGAPLLHKANLLLGIAVFMRCCADIPRASALSAWLRDLAPGSYFVYLAHSPLLQVFKKSMYASFRPASDPALIVVYFAAPFLTIALLLVLYSVLRARLPRVVFWLTGNSAGARARQTDPGGAATH